jgi:pentatricopeptide repeat protein
MRTIKKLQTWLIAVAIIGCCQSILYAALPRTLAQDDASATDRVRVRLEKKRPSDPEKFVDRSGIILSYNRDGIVLERAPGREITIKADEISSVAYKKTDEQLLAEKLHRQGEYLAAVTAFNSAMQIEQRTWVRQELMATLINCLVNTERWDEAARIFGTMIKSDPNSRFFNSIPLAWSERQLPGQAIAQAQTWIDTSEPIAQLMAASWLIGTPQRQQAVDVLNKLSRDNDPRIAHMASAQVWRTQFLTADGGDIERWQAQIQRMPLDLRAGPEFILARALSQNKKYTDAAAMLMKVNIVYQPDNRLRAAALYRAAQALQLANSIEQAQLIFNELITDYPDSEEAQFARQAMQKK